MKGKMKMKKLTYIINLLLLAAITTNAQQSEFPKLIGLYFGQKPPEDKPVLFAPGYISCGIDHCSPSFNPDGKEIYFELLDKNEIAKIGYTKLVQGIWSKPDTIPFCKNNSFISGNPFITPDGKKMFFTSFRPGSVSEYKENIWCSERTSKGWSNPKPVSANVNKMRIHWSISVSNSGTLFFQGNKIDKSEEGGIYFSKLINGKYAKPVRMGSEINSGRSVTCPYVSPDESYIIFTRMGTGPQDSGIFISFKDKTGNWIPAVMLEGGTKEKGGMSPKITPDGKYLFYVNGGIWWMPIAKIIEELRPKE